MVFLPFCRLVTLKGTLKNSRCLCRTRKPRYVRVGNSIGAWAKMSACPWESRTITPQEISALILRHLKQAEVDHKEPKNILVYDLGGGTFDVSVVRLNQDVTRGPGQSRQQPPGRQRLRRQAGGTRHHPPQRTGGYRPRRRPLCRGPHRTGLRDGQDRPQRRPLCPYRRGVPAEKDGEPVHLSLELERLKYEDMITAYIDETLEAVHIALKGAGLAATDIQEILLVGGATRTPLIRRRLERELGMQSRSELDPDLCVTTGAAIQAATISGQQVSGVLVDVTPYTFGTSAWSDRNGEPYPYTLHPPDPQKHTDSRHQKRGLRDHAPRSADDRGADLPRRGPGRPQQYQDRLLPDRGPERCPRRQHHRDHLCAGCKRHPQRHLPREAHGAEEAGRRPPNGARPFRPRP